MPDYTELLNAPAGDVKRPPNIPAGTWRLQVLKYAFDKRGQNKTDCCLVDFKLLAPHTKDDGTPADVVPTELAEFLEFYGGDASKRQVTVTFWMTQDAMHFLTQTFLIGALRLDPSISTKELLPQMMNRECLGTITTFVRNDGSGTGTSLDASKLAPLPV